MHQQPQEPWNRHTPPGQPRGPQPPEAWGAARPPAGQPYQQPGAYGAYQPSAPAYQQPPVVVNAAVPHPRRAVTKRPLSPVEHMFHLFMTLCTAGLWGFVWWSRVRSRRTVTTWD